MFFGIDVTDSFGSRLAAKARDLNAGFEKHPHNGNVAAVAHTPESCFAVPLPPTFKLRAFPTYEDSALADLFLDIALMARWAEFEHGGISFEVLVNNEDYADARFSFCEGQTKLVYKKLPSREIVAGDLARFRTYN